MFSFNSKHQVTIFYVNETLVIISVPFFQLSNKSSLAVERKTKCKDDRNSTASLSPEEKEIERYKQENFIVELEDTFGIVPLISLLLQLLLVTYYAYLLKQPLLKEYFLQVGNRHLANATDLLIVTWKGKFY